MRLCTGIAHPVGNDVMNRVAGTIVLVFLIGITVFTGAVFWRLPVLEPVQDKVPVTHQLPLKCRPLYNVGKHKEWAECIGVGYVDE